MTQTATQSNTQFGGILDNSQEVSRIEELRNKKITAKPQVLAFALLAFLGIFMVGFMALQIITGVLALAVTGVFCVGAFFGIKWLKHLNPVVQQKMRNKQLKMMTEEAKRNAIQQLENRVIDDAERLKNAKRSRNKMGATVERLKNSLDPSRKGEPVYQKKLEMIERLDAAYQQVIKNLDIATKANLAFEKKVADYKELDQIAGEINEAMSLFDQSGDNKLRDMLSLESFNHIESEFSEALISIENSARDMDIDGE